MSCTAFDLINIQPLALSDTFHTWFDRTNEAIDAVNSLNIYNVTVGPTSGLSIESGCQNGFYNGNIRIETETGGGIGIGSANYTGRTNEIVIDFVDLSPFTDGGVSANPAIGDYYLISDISDTSQGPAGTPRRIEARYMLPPKITMGATGQGTLEIEGNLTVKENLFVLGDSSYLQINDLKIEDKIIEIASSPYTEIMVEGSVSAIAGITGGLTAYDNGGNSPVLPYDPGSALVIAKVRRVERQAGGTTASVQFNKPSTGDFSTITSIDYWLFGDLSSGVTAQGMSVAVTGNGLFPDDVLSPAGVVIKGENSDKEFLWTNDHNRWATNTNLGVSSKNSLVVSSKFGSYGFTGGNDRDNVFTFVGISGSDVTLSLANGYVNTGVTGWENSSWKFTKKATPGALQDHQKLEFVHDSGATAYPIATFYAGRTGPTYTGVGVSGWAQHLNSDMVDGAHAYLTPSPYSIAVSNSTGRIDPNWLSADSIRKTITIGGHAFATGDVVRYDNLGGITYASATNPEYAEAVGMVAGISGNTIDLVIRGFVDNLPTSGNSKFAAISPALTGSVYFLSANTPGGMIINPDIGLTDGQVRKAMFMSLGGGRGYVLDQIGVIVAANRTDTLYIPSIAPAGAIHPFAGATTSIPVGWLLCDGKAYARPQYTDLYYAIGQNHHADATVHDPATRVIEFADNTRNLAVNNGLRIEWTDTSGIQSFSCEVDSVDVATKRVTLKNITPNTSGLPTGGSVIRVFGGDHVTNSNMVFFVPDLRARTPFGVNAAPAPLSAEYSLGAKGGASSRTMPSHAHNLVQNQTGSGGLVAASDIGVVKTGQVDGSVLIPTMPPFVAMHWIIRAISNVSATILSGHDHDTRYVRYDAAQTINDAGKNQFHTNAAVLSDGTIGPDTFYDSLTVKKVLAGVTCSDWSWWADSIPNAGGPQWTEHSRQMWNNSGLRVMGSGSQGASIHVFNTNTENYWQSAYDQCSINFWGVGVSGVTAPARYIFGITPVITQLDVATQESVTGRNRRVVNFNIGGMTDGRAVYQIVKDEDPSVDVHTYGNDSSWMRKTRFLYPMGITSSPVHTANMRHLMVKPAAGNAATVELVEYTGTALSGSDLYTTGGITFAGAAQMTTGNALSDTAILTVDQSTGAVSRRMMLEVTAGGPPTEGDPDLANYPEGFVWYNTVEYPPPPTTTPVSIDYEPIFDANSDVIGGVETIINSQGLIFYRQWGIVEMPHLPQMSNADAQSLNPPDGRFDGNSIKKIILPMPYNNTGYSIKVSLDASVAGGINNPQGNVYWWYGIDKVAQYAFQQGDSFRVIAQGFSTSTSQDIMTRQKIRWETYGLKTILF